jgi:2-desacetyl-2-hydroxyethyl bacteriochlorophyllide A dehydrogenase
VKASAVWFVAPQRVEIRDVELPEVTVGEVLVRTRYSGISAGTELLAYRGQLDPSLPLDEKIGALEGTFSYPFPYGYSCVGEVERSRADVAEGTPVFVLHPHQDRFVAPAADAVVVDGVDPRQATLLPLVETALQITLDAGPVTREPVVVTGLGPVGLLTALLLQQAGAQVLASEPAEWRRKVAAELGAEAVDPGELGDEVAARTGGHGVPLLVEVSGQPAALASGLPLLAHEGTALVASWYGTKPVELPLGADFHRRRLVIRSTQVSSIPAHLGHRWTVERRRAAARRLLAELPLAQLATHEFPVTAAQEAFAAVDRGDEGLLHAALAYR